MLKKKLWQISPSLDQETLNRFQDFSPVVAQLLVNRGFNTPEAAKSFLSQSEFAPHDPFLLQDMQAACELIIKHVKAKNKIAIAGDYDADGVTSSAVLTETLSTLRAEVEVWIPSRMRDGYGLSCRIIDEIKAGGAKLIITVDNGIRGIEEAKYAKSIGLDIIVTDHHTVGGEPTNIPDCLVINPIVAREKYPFRFLAGVGVAYKLASAIISLTKLDDSAKNILRQRILDLVAIGTVADCVALLDENRYLVREGLKQMNRQPRLGIAALSEISQIKGAISEWQIGWQLGPRLNVAGRLAHANTAYQLLITKDKDEAARLANELNEQNILRQSETARIVDHCCAIVDAELSNDKILVLMAPDITDPSAATWFEGVIGLAAGKLVERYGRPALVICQSEGNIKGSGRSIGDYSIVGAVEEAQEHLLRHGGHRAACGFSVKDAASLQKFAEQVRAIGERDLTDELMTPKLAIEAVIEASEINMSLAESLKQFSPFGQGNPLPIFASYNLTISDINFMGFEKQHIKLRIGSVWAISFGGAERWKDFGVNDKINLAYTVEINDFNNRQSVQLKIVDMVKAE